MSYITRVTWYTELVFDVELQGHHFKVDADAEFGGRDAGPRPKALCLAALAGCTGMDVASILKKMRLPFDSFYLEVDEKTSKDHPQVYKEILVRYIFSGPNMNREKIEKAVNLSLEKYCGVNAMLGKTAEVKHEIILRSPTE